MFSSEQVFKISGDFSQLKQALQFAMVYSGQQEVIDRHDPKCKMVWQISESGWYCVGWAYNNPQEGWNEFQFDFDSDIVSKIIEQHLKKLDYDSIVKPVGDGGKRKGFLMSAGFFRGDNEFKNPFFGIVYFRPFWNFYAK